MRSVVSECVEEIRAEQALAAGVCPVVEALYRGTQGGAGIYDDVSAFCAVCPDADDVPDACPELQDDSWRVRTCILYRDLSDRWHSPQGGCIYAQPGRTEKCTCFTPKGKEWHEEFDRWNARRKRNEKRIRKWDLERNAYSDW